MITIHKNVKCNGKDYHSMWKWKHQIPTVVKEVSLKNEITHFPLSEKMPKNLPWIVATINEWCFHFHLHHVACWTHLGSSPLHDAAIALYTTLPPHGTFNLKSHNLIITLHSFPFHHIVGSRKAINNVFPLLVSRIKYCLFLDINLIFGTFLETTSTIFIPLY